MNSDNFNNNLNQNDDSGIKNTHGNKPELPQNLSRKQRVLFVSGAAIFMLVCSIINISGILSGTSDALIRSGSTSMLIYAIVGGVCALLTLDCPKLAAIPPLLSLVASLVIFFVRDGELSAEVVLVAVSSLSPAVCGVIIAVSMKKGARRSGAILAGAVALALFGAVMFCVGSLLLGQSIDVGQILDAVENTRQELINYLAQSTTELSEMLGSDVSGLDFESVVNSVFNMLPALVVLTFALYSFVAQLSLIVLCRMCGLYHRLEKKDTGFSVTVPTAIIYAATALIPIFIPSEYGVVGTVFENLNMILLPSLAFTGLMSFLPRRDGNVVRIGCFPLVILVILLITIPSIAVLLLAVMGTVGTLRAAYREIKNNKSN